jgi:bifunctional NMN adenylyltransferase/nudix hydrolase
MKNSEWHNHIVNERKFIDLYKSQYASLSFPPVFVTVDVVVFQAGHVLMVRRNAYPGKGLMALPGGFLDASRDASLEDAMIRELREETGLKVPSPVLRGSIENTKVFDSVERSSRGRTITHAFNIKLPLGELPRVKGGSDADKAFWVPFSELNSRYCFEDHYQIIQYFL